MKIMIATLIYNKPLGELYQRPEKTGNNQRTIVSSPTEVYQLM